MSVQPSPIIHTTVNVIRVESVKKEKASTKLANPIIFKEVVLDVLFIIKLPETNQLPKLGKKKIDLVSVKKLGTSIYKVILLLDQFLVAYHKGEHEVKLHREHTLIFLRNLRWIDRQNTALNRSREDDLFLCCNPIVETLYDQPRRSHLSYFLSKTQVVSKHSNHFSRWLEFFAEQPYYVKENRQMVTRLLFEAAMPLIRTFDADDKSHWIKVFSAWEKNEPVAVQLKEHPDVLPSTLIFYTSEFFFHVMANHLLMNKSLFNENFENFVQLFRFSKHSNSAALVAFDFLSILSGKRDELGWDQENFISLNLFALQSFAFLISPVPLTVYSIIEDCLDPQREKTASEMRETTHVLSRYASLNRDLFSRHAQNIADFLMDNFTKFRPKQREFFYGILGKLLSHQQGDMKWAPLFQAFSASEERENLLRQDKVPLHVLKILTSLQKITEITEGPFQESDDTI